MDASIYCSLKSEMVWSGCQEAILKDREEKENAEMCQIIQELH